MSATNEGRIGKAWRWRGIFRRDIAASVRRWRALDLREWLREQLETEASARSGFFLLPLSMMLGILAVYVVGWRLPWWGCLGVAAGFAWPAVRSSRKLCLAVCGLALGLGLAGAEIGRRDTIILSGETTTRIAGRVLWRDRDDRGRHRYLVEVERTERPTLSRPPARVEILVAARHDAIAIGGTYAGLVRLRPPSGPALPGGYDFAFGAFQKGLGGYGFALGAPVPVPSAEGNEPALSIAERLATLRMAIGDRIRETIGGAEGAVAAAIITGERAGIPGDVDEWLRVAGLSHVLSISGLHMALVAGFAMGGLRVLFALLPALSLRFPTKKIAAVGAIAISAFYLALSGADVAAVRSFIMIAVMLTAVLFDRAALTLRNVAVAAVVVLCVTPSALLGPSFQMSFGATMALVAAYGAFPMRPRDGERRSSWTRATVLFFAGIALSSIVAGAATAPFAAYHFQRMAPFGLVANMLALPIFSFWIMPLALLAMLALPFGLDAPLLWALGEGLTLVFALARFLAERLPDSPTGLLTGWGLALLSIALLCACLFASRLRLVSIPIALLGLMLAPDRTAKPELLLFEDGREIAIVSETGGLRFLRKRANGFVAGQWSRAYPQTATAEVAAADAFTCETWTEPPPNPVARSATARPISDPARKPRERKFCRATTRSGLRIAWTDDYERLEQACREADVAIVARAVRAERCDTRAVLVTLRTLRATGSLAVHRGDDGRPHVAAAMPRSGEEWNRHRTEAWPERWRPSETAEAPRSDGAAPTSSAADQ